MREMLSPTSAIMGRGLGNDVALITDGRFSGGSHGFVIGHITPEAFEGGLLGIVENGDNITIDITKRTIDLEVSKMKLKGDRIAGFALRPVILEEYWQNTQNQLVQLRLGAVTDLY